MICNMLERGSEETMSRYRVCGTVEGGTIYAAFSNHEDPPSAWTRSPPEPSWWKSDMEAFAERMRNESFDGKPVVDVRVEAIDDRYDDPKYIQALHILVGSVLRNVGSMERLRTNCPRLANNLQHAIDTLQGTEYEVNELDP